MNEIFFYSGIVFAIGSLVIAFVLFFTLKIPEVIQFYADSIRHKKGNGDASMRKSTNKSIKQKGKKVVSAGPAAVSEPEATEILSSDPSAVEDIARNYATAMLNADESTEILSD